MSGERRKVLVVDDSRTTRRMIMWALKPLSFEMIEAENGRDALVNLENGAPDLVIVDLNMPVMDGIKFLQKARANPALQELPVLMLTTEGGEREMQIARAAGANAYLVKPSTPPKIRESVCALLGMEPCEETDRTGERG